MSGLAIAERPSPNHDARASTAKIDMLILHYTGMRSGDEAIERLCDRAAKVSAHYVVEKDGRIVRLVDEERRAWHAGVSYWGGETDINGHSIGIEIVNPGHEFGYQEFPDAQMASVTALCLDIMARHPIPAARVVGHSDVAPDRKQDPGELFNWRGLAAKGVGLWPDTPPIPTPLGEERARTALTRIGYNPDIVLMTVVIAFQRHFRPARVDGVLDEETMTLIGAYDAIS